MAVTEAEKMEIIKEYEQQQELEMLRRRCKVKPLCDARTHFEAVLKEKDLYWKEHSDYYAASFYHDVNEALWKALRKGVCDRFYLEKITDLKAEDYKKANEWCIQMIDRIFYRGS